MATPPTLPSPIPESAPASLFWKKYWPQTKGPYISPLETINVQRDDSQPSLPAGVVVPNTCQVFDPGLAKRFIPRYGSKILYRSAYKILDESLESISETATGLRVLTGQPGIGKTQYLYILLAQRLARGRPIVFQSFGLPTPLYFCSQGVYPITDLPSLTGNPDMIYPRIWALIDAYPTFTAPPDALIESMYFFFILAASPRKMHWHGWQKMVGPMSFYFLEPPPLEEVIQVLPFFRGIKPTEAQVITFYTKYGVSIRSALESARDPQSYEWLLAPAVQDIKSEVLTDAVLGSSLSAFEGSHQLLTVVPRPDSEHRASNTVIVTPHIYKLLASRHEELFRSQVHQFFRLCHSNPSSRATAGYIFEQWAHKYLVQHHDSDRDPLSIVPMKCTGVYDVNASYQFGDGPSESLDLCERTTTYFDKASDVIDGGLDPTIYYRPNKQNYPALDAFIYDYRGSAGEVTVFQMTVGQTHDVDNVKVDKILQAIAWSAPATSSFRYIAVIPSSQGSSIVKPTFYLPKGFHKSSEVRMYHLTLPI